jgi:hypothetical protein
MKKLYVATLGVMLLLFSANVDGQMKQGSINVEISSMNPLRLHVTLRSGADKRTAIDRGQLPWVTRYGMTLVAVKADGQCLERVLPVEDPPVGTISVEPRQVLTGDVNLDGIFKGLDEAKRKSDVHLFWAYHAPEGMGIARWSGGWILIPHDRKP